MSSWLVLLVVDECQRSLDSVAQEGSKVHSALCETVTWLGRVQDGLASLDPVSCDKDRLMLQSRDCEVCWSVFLLTAHTCTHTVSAVILQVNLCLPVASLFSSSIKDNLCKFLAGQRSFLSATMLEH